MIVMWREYRDPVAAEADGTWLEGEALGETVKVFMPREARHLMLDRYREAVVDSLLRRITPMDHYLLTGRCFA